MHPLGILVVACCLLDARLFAEGDMPTIPPQLLPLAREAKEQFEHGNYLEAEKIYRKILAKAPNNLYTLSNLGVVLFRVGKLKSSEETFKKAIAVWPEDGFSHCTLGIVYYSQGMYDYAVNELTKGLAINPKDGIAHNYLEIIARQKGWKEESLRDLDKATDPSLDKKAVPEGSFDSHGDFLTPREKEQLERMQMPPAVIK